MPSIQISEFRNYNNLSTNLKQIPPKSSYFQDHWCGRSDFLYLRRGKDILQSYRAVPVTLVPLRCTWLMNIWGWGWLVWSFWIYRYIDMCVIYMWTTKKWVASFQWRQQKSRAFGSQKRNPWKFPWCKKFSRIFSCLEKNSNGIELPCIWFAKGHQPFFHRLAI